MTLHDIRYRILVNNDIRHVWERCRTEYTEDGTPLRSIGTIQDITEQVLAQKELQRHTRQLKIVNAISEALSTSLELNELLKTILHQVVQVIVCDSAAIFLVENNDELRIVNAIGFAEKFLGKVIKLEDTLMKKIRPDQKVIIIDDVEKDPDYLVWDDGIPFHGWMGLPLYLRETLVGFLSFDSSSPHAFDAADASLAVAFATQVAQAIHNARLYERVIADANELEKHVQKRTQELQNFVDLTAGREIRMIELKEIIRELRRQLVRAGQVPVAGDLLDDV